VVARAEGEAFRFELLLAEYQQSPAVMRQRLYIDAIQEVLANTSKILVDVEGGNNMLFLPLDRIMDQGGQSAGAAPRMTFNSQQIRELADQVSREISSQSTADRSRVQTLPARRP
jgi:membrane protease subunit HflK